MAVIKNQRGFGTRFLESPGCLFRFQIGCSSQLNSPCKSQRSAVKHLGSVMGDRRQPRSAQGGAAYLNQKSSDERRQVSSPASSFRSRSRSPVRQAYTPVFLNPTSRPRSRGINDSNRQSSMIRSRSQSMQSDRSPSPARSRSRAQAASTSPFDTVRATAHARDGHIAGSVKSGGVNPASDAQMSNFCSECGTAFTKSIQRFCGSCGAPRSNPEPSAAACSGSASSASAFSPDNEVVAMLVARAWEDQGVRISLASAEMVLQRQGGDMQKALGYLGQMDGSSPNSRDPISRSPPTGSPVILEMDSPGESLRTEIRQLQQQLKHRKERARLCSERMSATLSQSGDHMRCLTILEVVAELEWREIACAAHSEVQDIHSKLRAQMQIYQELHLQPQPVLLQPQPVLLQQGLHLLKPTLDPRPLWAREQQQMHMPPVVLQPPPALLQPQPVQLVVPVHHMPVPVPTVSRGFHETQRVSFTIITD